MCGIAAIYHTASGDTAVERRSIQAMTDAMAHRGPDGEGHYLDDRIALGHRRLSILDLSDAGAQPMTSRTVSSNGRYVIVFNGEIYNYLGLNAMLAQRGIVAQSHSDTETLLNLYEVFGEGCLSYLRGMFAFVLWDKTEQKLFAARDRFGQKPLLYAQTKDKWVFASELKGILASGLIETRLNPAAVSALFETGSVMQPDTMIAGVQMLPAGHALTLHGRESRVWQYWDVPFTPFTPSPSPLTRTSPVPYGEAKEEVRRLFFEALKQHLISDVPLGVFLSGGIDSSLIVAAMQALGQETKTFSIGFDTGGGAYNETHHAKEVADLYHTRHLEVILSEREVTDNLDDIVYGIDQPSSDGLNSYMVSKVARREVTVALSGLGSDELFGGYTTFKFAQRLMAFQRLTAHLPSFVGAAAAGLDEAMPLGVQENWQWRGLIGLAGGYRDAARLYSVRTLTPPAFQRKLFSPAFQPPTQTALSAHRRALQQPAIRAAGNLIQEISYLELKFYMMNTLLRDTDAMSMKNSLEVRVPFIDHVLAEFVASLPASYKIDRSTTGIGKKILIDAFSDLLPHRIVHRKKMGFVFPLGAWMRRGRLREVITDTLSESALKARGIFDVAAVQAMVSEFLNSDDTSTRGYRTYLRVWMATLLELWMRRFKIS